MWYIDPFVMVPILFGMCSLVSFAILICLAKTGYRKCAMFMAVVSGAFASTTLCSSAFAYMLTAELFFY